MQIEDFGAVLKEHGVLHGAGVPCSYFKPLVNYMTVEPDLDYLTASSEGEAVSIGAGLCATGKAAFALMQNSGLGNAVNPVTSLLHVYDIPLILLVSHRGQPDGQPDEPQHALMGRITEDLAKLCALRTAVLPKDKDAFAAQLVKAQELGLAAAWICRKGTLEGGPPAPPIHLRIDSHSVVPEGEGVYEPRLTREEALRALLPILNEGLEEGSGAAVISTTGKLSRELYELDDRGHDKRNRFYMVGSMGCASGFGLGVARGQPERSVIVLDGDGALLMKLGTLAAIGHHAPKRLLHLVFDNGAHESTGGQPTLSSTVDFAMMALAAGYRQAGTVADLDSLFELAGRYKDLEGPSLIRIVIKAGSRADLGRPKHNPKDRWRWFCDYLAG